MSRRLTFSLSTFRRAGGCPFDAMGVGAIRPARPAAPGAFANSQRATVGVLVLRLSGSDVEVGLEGRGPQSVP